MSKALFGAAQQKKTKKYYYYFKKEHWVTMGRFRYDEIGHEFFFNKKFFVSKSVSNRQFRPLMRMRVKISNSVILE